MKWMVWKECIPQEFRADLKELDVDAEEGKFSFIMDHTVNICRKIADECEISFMFRSESAAVMALSLSGLSFYILTDLKTACCGGYPRPQQAVFVPAGLKINDKFGIRRKLFLKSYSH